MGLPGSNLSAKKVLLSPKRLISSLRVIRRPQDKEEGELLIVVEYPSSPSLHLPLPAPQLGVRSPHAPDLGDISLLRRYVLMVRGHLSPLPFPYHWLRPEDVLVGEHPIAAGGFANIHEAMHGGRKVILKSYRCYVLFDVAQVVARFHSEVHVSSLLHRGGVEVVRLLGLYSTEAHPFGLVYEYMGGLDLRQHLRNNPNVGRLNLLAGIARCLSQIHSLGIIHGRLQMTNVLIDRNGTPRIGGLGNASILPHSTPWTEVGAAKVNDMFALGILAREVFTARSSASLSGERTQAITT